jgi:uncharacterized protein (TIGR00369 family)
MSDLDASAQDFIARMLLSPQSASLKLQLISASPGRVALRLPWRAELAGDPDAGVIAGGAVTTLLDHVCGLAVGSTRPAGAASSTLDLRIDYMRAAAPRADVTGEAHCYRITHNIAFVRAQAYDADASDPVATAQGVFMLIGESAS